jgi:hypothetical protein
MSEDELKPGTFIKVYDYNLSYNPKSIIAIVLAVKTDHSLQLTDSLTQRSYSATEVTMLYVQNGRVERSLFSTLSLFQWTLRKDASSYSTQTRVQIVRT